MAVQVPPDPWDSVIYSSHKRRELQSILLASYSDRQIFFGLNPHRIKNTYHYTSKSIRTITTNRSTITQAWKFTKLRLVSVALFHGQTDIPRLCCVNAPVNYAPGGYASPLLRGSHWRTLNLLQRLRCWCVLLITCWQSTRTKHVSVFVSATCSGLRVDSHQTLQTVYFIEFVVPDENLLLGQNLLH